MVVEVMGSDGASHPIFCGCPLSCPVCGDDAQGSPVFIDCTVEPCPIDMSGVEPC